MNIADAKPHGCWIEYNANPKNKNTDDCTIRAISLATGQSWDDVFHDLCALCANERLMPSDPKSYNKYLKKLGWVKNKQPRKENNKKYTGEEFCKEIAKPGVNYIAHIGGHHIVCIKDQHVWDTWNSIYGCIGNYWTKENIDG